MIFNNYQFLTLIYTTYIILTKLYNFNYYGMMVTQLITIAFL